MCFRVKASRFTVSFAKVQCIGCAYVPDTETRRANVLSGSRLIIHALLFSARNVRISGTYLFVWYTHTHTYLLVEIDARLEPVRDGEFHVPTNCSSVVGCKIINNILGNLFPLSGCELVKNIYERYDISNGYK